MDINLNKKAYTIVELLVVLSLMLVLAFLAIPPAAALKDSFISEGIVVNTVESALANARARAVSEGRPVGVRFQRGIDGSQYMVFVQFIGDIEGMHSSRQYAFEPVPGRKPVELPAGYSICDMRKRSNYSNETIYGSVPLANPVEPKNLNDTTTFTVCFSPAGKAVVRKVRIFPDYRKTDREDILFAGYDDYSNQGNLQESKILLSADDSAANGYGGEESRLSRITVFKNLDYQKAENKGGFLFQLPKYRINAWTGGLLKTEAVN
ncbi:hypothetical protein [Sedimentisphaera salicampi]|uniref:Tfp pilus assembly protein FimT n=1 Tax=Sedimentisphaera salicampi TaxID=1941349 RepID=A0A1W6LPI1_9BACT|nr:hypothetical protein [Sedimentisphaera salicampi]ARN57633.1 Tfp pilus assembly protein FimT [Sedimentisphaera salicampi]